MKSKKELIASLDTFTKQYLETALWSSDDDNGIPLDKNYTIENCTVATIQQAIDECAKFQRINAADLTGIYGLRMSGKTIDPSNAGHDFWLTRNGHGVGFWDGDYPNPEAQRLTESSKAFGPRHFNVWGKHIYT